MEILLIGYMLVTDCSERLYIRTGGLKMAKYVYKFFRRQCRYVNLLEAKAPTLQR